MSVIINPGSGPVGGASREQAEACVEQFVADLNLPDIEAAFVKECRDSRYDRATQRFVDAGLDGRFSFALTLGDRTTEIDMPGLAVEKVRYLGDEGQNIWDFPRLYVDGSSWVWCFALSNAQRALTGEDEGEDDDA